MLKLYSAFSGMVLISVILHFWASDRYVMQNVIEGYLGSVETMKLFTNWPDRFRNPANASDLIKNALIHFFAFSLYGFCVFHLLFKVYQNKKFVAIVACIYMCTSLGVVLAPFSFFIHAIAALIFYYINTTIFFCALITITLMLMFIPKKGMIYFNH